MMSCDHDTKMIEENKRSASMMEVPVPLVASIVCGTLGFY
ncbi:Uncharacterized protein APZ42_012823 [Daphnia magna]|uniref:Uncharacterized protein n=1 Tax=Daphnia magna TaxID=35525 RepID=A0A162RE30_9CRUS|nr:Uncharacterized protein APZ42_012823 [Daphnia magna]